MNKWKKQCGIIIVVVVLIGLFCLWQNNALSDSYFTITHKKIDENLAGFKIVQISDLHNKQFGKNQERLLKQIQEYNPDMIVVTGDLVDDNRTDIEAAMEFIRGAVTVADVYYVTGNHELWLEPSERELLLQQLEQAGVFILNNTSVEITYRDTCFTLIGLDDKNLADDTLKNIMKQVDDKSYTVLLAHEPQYMDRYVECDVDLVLSGHAHGGQFRIPFIGGLFAPDQGFFPEYDAGLYSENETDMIVSRGLGNSVIPLRLFNRPEIVYVELETVQ